MKKLLTILILLATITSCKKSIFKKEEGSFKLNGTKYSANEDMMSGGYYSGNSLLYVNVGGGPSSTYSASVVVDLTKVNQTMPINSLSEGFVAYGANNAIRYLPVSGSYTITSHSTSITSQHTEGTFQYEAVNEYVSTDTIHITEGYFYITNY